MKPKFGKQFVLIPVGLFLISIAVFVLKQSSISDSAKGILFGIPIGIMIIFFISIRFKRINKIN